MSVVAPNKELERRAIYLLAFVAGIVLVAGLLAAGYWRRISNSVAIFDRPHQTSVTQSVVVEKVQAVAKLVSSETTLRDVVIYEDTWYGSTKRSLVVVTGKVLAGINLEQGSSVKIDEAAKRITITLPQAAVLAVDIGEMKTYDEQRGLWNPFQPADRDKVYQLARAQFGQTAQQMKLTEHANESAKKLLETMFSTDGYQTTVVYR